MGINSSHHAEIWGGRQEPIFKYVESLVPTSDFPLKSEKSPKEG
jgi:hypothetical protein